MVPPEGWEPEAQPIGQSADVVGADAGEVDAAGGGGELSGNPPIGVSPAELAWRKWLLLGAAPAAGLVVVLGVCSVFFWRDRPQPQPTAVVQQPADAIPGNQPVPPDPPPDPAPPEPAPEPVPEQPNYDASDESNAYRQPDQQQLPDTAIDPSQPPTDPLSQTQEPGPVLPKPFSPGAADANQRPGSNPIEPVPLEPAPDVSPELKPDGLDRQTPPIRVDVEARLAEMVPEIELKKVPLAAAVDLLAGISGVPTTFDPEAMQQLGVTLHDPVTVELSGATVGQTLEKVLADRGLAAQIEDGQILLTSPVDRREKLERMQYTVSDLTGQQPAAVAELAALVEKLVAPDSWSPSGGRGSIKPDGGTLDVVQTGAVHHQVLAFCEKLRVARGKPLRSKYSPDRFGLATRLDRARAALNRPVTANFHEPTPLIEVLAYLGRLAETDLLVDRLALGAVGLSDRTAASVSVQKRPLGEALQELLGPLDLEYRAIDAATLQVTTRRAVAARLELEFYPLAKLLTGGSTGPALVEQIKGRVAGSTWSGSGGPGVLHFDPPSSCLIVLQSQPVQVAVERLLAELPN